MSQTLTVPRGASRPASIQMACRTRARALRTTLRDAVHAWAIRRVVHALQSLDDRLLEDIGLARSEIEWRVRHHAWW